MDAPTAYCTTKGAAIEVAQDVEVHDTSDACFYLIGNYDRQSDEEEAKFFEVCQVCGHRRDLEMDGDKLFIRTEKGTGAADGGAV